MVENTQPSLLFPPPPPCIPVTLVIQKNCTVYQSDRMNVNVCVCIQAYFFLFTLAIDYKISTGYVYYLIDLLFGNPFPMQR